MRDNAIEVESSSSADVGEKEGIRDLPFFELIKTDKRFKQ